MEPSETGQSMGHEAIGIVEDVGAEVRNLERGDLVVMPFASSDYPSGRGMENDPTPKNRV
jgi:threonine dehydrogenase-like Zn-dependent dehydrogenase